MSEEIKKEAQDVELDLEKLDKVAGGQRSAYHYFWDRVEPLIIKYGLSSSEWRELEKVCTPEEWAQVLDGVNYALSLGYDLDWL